ncbi:MAG TPA: tetratricopeptide repeat protein, partial [bacterium]|nr:tetratricopeptide repeat protein [bacterium]
AFLYLETGDIEKAEQIFNLLSSDNQVELQIRRSATIGLGDAARYKADIKNASKFYESVMLDTQIERKTGVYSQQVLFYLKKNDFSTAIEKLTLWADEIPTAKIKGNWSILFARAHILKKDYEKAMKEIETFLKISSSIDNPYYGWAVYLKGEIYLDEGEKEKAREIFEKVMETFSATQIANMAKEKLKEMEK